MRINTEVRCQTWFDIDGQPETLDIDFIGYIPNVGETIRLRDQNKTDKNGLYQVVRKMHYISKSLTTTNIAIEVIELF